jgi:hypothetical protein
MAPRQFSQHLHPNEDMLQTSTHNHPPTQIIFVAGGMSQGLVIILYRRDLLI